MMLCFGLICMFWCFGFFSGQIYDLPFKKKHVWALYLIRVFTCWDNYDISGACSHHFPVYTKSVKEEDGLRETSASFIIMFSYYEYFDITISRLNFVL